MEKTDKSTPTVSSRAARTAARSVLFVAKVTGKIGWAIARPIGRQASKLAVKGGQAVKDHAVEKIAEYELRNADYTPENFYDKAATTLEDLVDALLIEKRGTSARIVKALSVKLGAAGTTAGVFSVASVLGTASTGTAISSLSGAAFNNAALAWLGGSVVAGGWIILGAAAVGGIAAYFGSRKLLATWTGKRRKKKELDGQERQFVETCLMLATAFRKRAENNDSLDRFSAGYLHQQLSEDLRQQLDACMVKVAEWPCIPLMRLKERKTELEKMLTALSQRHENKPRRRATSHSPEPVLTGVVSATILKLTATDTPIFSGDEELVLDALRRSNNALTDASEADLAAYVQSLTIEQIAGLKNNVKGIYHELAFQHRENTDGDDYIVELFEDTNHAGADVRIVNVVTGDVSDVQLKATNYASYVRAHNEKYENIEVLTTSEVASTSSDWTSSGFSNQSLSAHTSSTLSKLEHGVDASIVESMGVAAMVTLAANAKSMLKGDSLSADAKQKIIQNGVVAASVAGMVQLIL